MRRSLFVAGAAFALTTAAGFLPGTAWAGGFYLPEIGPRAVGMSGAMTAQSIDTTAMFYNPANLAGQPGTQVQAAGSLFFPQITYYRAPLVNPTTGERETFDKVENTNVIGGAPYFGVSSDVKVKNLAVGLAVYVPFAAHIVYPDDGAQRYVVTELDLKTIYVSPTVAYKFWDRLSVGVGLSYIYSSIGIRQANFALHVPFDPEGNPNPDPEFDGTTTLEGHDPGSFGANVGVTYTDPDGRFAFGTSVMTPTNLRFEGEAVIENESIAEYPEQDLEAGRRSDDFVLIYPVPLVVRLGAMVRPHERVTLALDVNWTRWKTFDTLVVDFEHNYDLLPTPGGFMADVVMKQNWRNAMSARFGADVTPLDPARIPLHLRVGAMFDQSPIDDRYFDVLAPDSDKLGVSGGLGYTFSLGRKVKMDVDLAYMHVFLKERNIGPVNIGPDENPGNDDDDVDSNDTMDNGFQTTVPGTEKTLLNKPAPSFFYGVTRVAFDILSVGVAVRI